MGHSCPFSGCNCHVSVEKSNQTGSSGGGGNYPAVAVVGLVALSCSTLCDPMACSLPGSMGFSRQEHWSEFPFPPSGDLPNPGIEPRSPALQVDSLPAEPPEKPIQEAGRCYLAPTENPNKAQVLYDSLVLISRKPGDPPTTAEGLYLK